MASFGYGWPKLLSPNVHKLSWDLESEIFSPIDIVTDERRKKLALLYEDKVVFWTTGRVRVVTGKLSTVSFKEKGSISCGCFRNDGRSFAVLLHTSYLLIYNLEPFHAPPGRSSWFDFTTGSDNQESQSTLKCANEYILPTLYIEKDLSTREDEFVLACKSCPSGIVFINSSLNLLSVSWKGQVLWCTSISSLVPLQVGVWDSQATNRLISIDYHRASELCGLVFGVLGIALLVRLGEEGRKSPEIEDVFVLRESEATCIALDPQQYLAAVGLKNGLVEIYNTSLLFVGGQSVCLRSLSLASLYLSSSDTGMVVSLEWTLDGNCIAVGYEKIGVVVWSAFGHCVFHTFSSFTREEICPLSIQEMHINDEQRNPSVSSGEETDCSRRGYLFRRVKAVCWDSFGYSLFILGSVEWSRDSLPTSSCHVPFCLVEFYFLKTGASCQSEATRSFLLGCNFFLSQENAQTSHPYMVSYRNKLMQHVEAPCEYISNNWPLRCISANDDKSFVAVSGKYGVAIYNVRLKRWRLFGDVVEERMIQCCSLCWYGRSIVIGNEVAVQNRKACRYELLIFSRDALYFSAIQAQIPLDGAPLLLDARKDGYLLVFGDDLQLRLLQLKSDRFKYNYSTIWTFHITVEAPLASPRRTRKERRSFGTFVSSVRIYPPTVEEKDIPKQVLLLKSTGSLILLDIPNGISIPLLRKVHSFWFHNVDCLPVETMTRHSLAIWAVAEDGIYCLFDSSREEMDSVSPVTTTQSPGAIISNSSFVSYKWFQEDINMYPLGTVEYGGFLSGVSPLQRAVATISLDKVYCRLPCFGIQIERQEIVSKHFLYWLADDTVEDLQCLKWMESFSESEHFQMYLERALYELLVQVETHTDNVLPSPQEDELQRRMEPVSATFSFPVQAEYALSRFMRIVKYFGEYEDVIVGCARKMEHKYWKLLFSYVGEPCLLFENCCLTNRLMTAAKFLMIIQEWWDLQVAVMHAWRLLQCCLEKGQVDIAQQVVAFFDRAIVQGIFPIPSLEIREEEKRLLESGVVVVAEITTPQNPIFALLLRHLGIYLERKQWMLALNISMQFGISLSDYWKIMETNFSFKQFSTILLSLHESFGWPFPCVDVVNKKWMRREEEDIGVSMEKRISAKLYDWKNTTCVADEEWKGEKYYRMVRQQLQYLTGNAFVARQWLLVLCGWTMLLNCEELRWLLNSHKDWIPSYVQGLEKCHVAGYRTLASKWDHQESSV